MWLCGCSTAVPLSGHGPCPSSPCSFKDTHSDNPSIYIKVKGDYENNIFFVFVFIVDVFCLEMAKQNSPSLVEVVKQVAEQQHTQVSEIEKSKAVLLQLQAQLKEVEKQMDSVLAETKTTERQMYQQDEAIETTTHDCESLEAQVRSLYAENVKLKLDTEMVQEDFEVMLLRNNAYREKITAHKEFWWETESKLPIMADLAKKRDMVKDLMAKKEELMHDLQNPEGNALKPLQEETVYLKREINLIKESIGERKRLCEEEKTVHTKLQKEIEVQHKRCEAILKRLHCQVNKLESNKRQCHWNIQQLEKKAAELRLCLGITEQ
uniref:Coiled-coil domain containing 122 n=1 Tax=Sphenodon punctatus TaxID=8508 RepID=A0A8D0LAL9_SPHPU